MKQPYRSIEGADQSGPIPAELVCRIEQRKSSLNVPIGLVMALAIVACVVNGFWTATVALVVGLLVLGRVVLRQDRGDGLVFRVQAGGLIVSRLRSGDVLARMRLVDLENVSLETKSIRKVEPGRYSSMTMHFLESSVGPEVDVSRLVLEGPSRVSLTDERIPYMHAVEWMGKIRTFLRQHGWKPLEGED